MLELSIALHDNPRTGPILDGRVRPQGVQLLTTIVHGSEMFWRQLKFGDFDVSEMSLSSLMIATAQGDDRWVALPVFTMRRFFHLGILIRTDRGIEQPRDLIGKRVGVPEYQQTSAVWSRGILASEFGVPASEIEWFMERGPDRSHGNATGFTPPAGVVIHQIPETRNIGEMMAGRDLDATLLYLRDPNMVDRSRIDLDKHPAVGPLFGDPTAEGKRYFGKTGFIPINHAIVVRRTLLEKHPWLALNLYSAFVSAQSQLLDATRDYLLPFHEAGLIPTPSTSLSSGNPMAYGFRHAKPVLDTLSAYVCEQGLTPQPVPPESFFAPSTLAT